MNLKIENSFKKSILGFIIGFLAMELFFDDIYIATITGIIFMTTTFFYFLTEPERKTRKEASEIEAQLPFALMQLSLELNIGIPPDRALERLAESKYGKFSILLGNCISSAKASGEPLKEMLAKFAAKSNSKIVKRAFSQVISIYEHGGKKQGSGIKKLAMELLSRKKAEIKEYAGKMSALSLLFIVISAVVPALSISLIIAGSSFIDFSINGNTVLVLSSIIFPCIDCAILLYIKSIAPSGVN